MARARNLKPSFFKNEYLAQLSPHARLLFAGLWTLADREGRLEDRPLRIKAELFPYEDLTLDDLLNDLQSANFIVRYEADDCAYIQILNFSKHQAPHVKEGASTIPAPCLSGAKSPPSPFPKPPSPTNGQQAGPKVVPRFADFWSAYPRKVKKKQAADLWKRKKLDGIADQIIADIEARIADDKQWEETRLIPHPTSYLNAERWTDEWREASAPEDRWKRAHRLQRENGLPEYRAIDTPHRLETPEQFMARVGA